MLFFLSHPETKQDKKSFRFQPFDKGVAFTHLVIFGISAVFARYLVLYGIFPLGSRIVSSVIAWCNSMLATRFTFPSASIDAVYAISIALYWAFVILTVSIYLIILVFMPKVKKLPIPEAY